MTTETLSFLKVLNWTADECRSFLESQRWPNGPVCPYCGGVEPTTVTRRTRTKNLVQRLYACRECRKQFTVTVGTVFHDSHIPLNKWLAAIMLMCSSKKGVSAHQLWRMLWPVMDGKQTGSYRTAWYMAHRVREAMADKLPLPIEGTVEADVTFVGGSTRRGHPTYHERVQDEIKMGLRDKDGVRIEHTLRGRPHARTLKAPVFGMMERGGKVRTTVLQGRDENAKEIRPILRANLAPTVRLITDAHGAYRAIKKYVRHDVVKHEVEYVNAEKPDIHIQNIESYWSLLKRGMVGTFHHVSRGYLPMYLSEFEYRFNRRTSSDAGRFASLLTQTEGRLAWRAKKA